MSQKPRSSGRTRSFEEAEVLSGAMQAFRRHGYRGVSVRDLEVATGISVGSLYNAYGDKDGVFQAAFRHYNEVVLKGRLNRYAPAEAGLAGVREAFRTLLHEPDGGAFGCLITNSAVELGDQESPNALVLDALDVLRRTFTERLTAARLAGDLPESVHPESAALQLLALYQGVLVLVRGGYDSTALEQLINDHFNALEGNHAP
ncbi:MAG TPA: TetR/AcrR family transcriptional regulator [Kineosporiaceae bacterium]|nr:TetR/AcrR family transcriptional regulator [Kineosporiaceae bacterium]